MNQRLEEDRAELEAHFAERVQAYIELGETPEQAKDSALKKFGQTETVIRKLRQQRILNSRILWAAVTAAGILMITYFGKRSAHQYGWINAMFPSLFYALFLWKGPRAKHCRSVGGRH